MSGLEFGQLAAHGFAKLTGAQRDAGADRPVAATASGSIVLPDGTEMMRSESGVIGIGVTPSPWHVNFKGIQTGGGYASFVGDGSNGRAEVLTNAYASGANTFSYFASLPATRYSQQLDSHIWYIAPSGTTGNPISFTQAMTLDGFGNLLVGTNSSDGKLCVASSGYKSTLVLRNLSASNGSYSEILFAPFMGTTAAAAAIRNIYSTNDNSNITFHTTSINAATQERARIDSFGNLLVGTTSAVEKLTLSGRAFLVNQSAPATPAGGGVIYVEDGALKYIGSSGTVTTLAPA